jgi:hypothetical protein
MPYHTLEEQETMHYHAAQVQQTLSSLKLVVSVGVTVCVYYNVTLQSCVA